jgi:hypothetical protein
MSRGLFLGTLLGTLLFAGPFLSAPWAQDKAAPGPPYPAGSVITFQWNYSCPSSRGCAFRCPDAGGAASVTKLTIYLGTMPVGVIRDAPGLFYEFSTLLIPRANGFTIGGGLSTLSCQVNGMILDYSGPPK